ncbi:MAG: acyloxyacyl hydrolase [Bacteroidales bacterium]|nr:acyloxyacyl hydrolase [Bacteroidales bacterium]
MGVRSYFGFLSSHHPEMNQFRDHFASYELSLVNATYGLEQWQQTTDYPQLGLSLLYTGLGENPELGQSIAIIPSMDFSIFRKQNFRTFFHLGMGFAYLTKKFDALDNNQNLIIGSHINIAVNISALVQYRLNKYWHMQGGLAFIHFSNGSTKTPNFGINIPSVFIGTHYLVARENKNMVKQPRRRNAFSHNPNDIIRARFGASAGIKRMDSEVGKTFGVYHFYTDISKQFNFVHNFGIGIDFTNDGSDQVRLHTTGLISPKIGAYGYYAFCFSRVTMNFGLGWYLYRVETHTGNLYERLSLDISLTKSLYATVFFRAHGTQADFIGYGLGYKFNVWSY